MRSRQPSAAAIDPGQQASYELEFRLDQKLDQFDEALLAASGIRLEALADDGVVTPGQSVTVSIFATVERDRRPRASAGDRCQASRAAPIAACEGPLTAGKAITCKATAKIPAEHALLDAVLDAAEGRRPLRLRARRALRRAVSSVALPRQVCVEVRDDRTTPSASRSSVRSSIRYSDVMAGEKRMDLKVVPAFNVRVSPDIAVIPAREAARRRDVRVTVTNNEKGAASGAVTCRYPAAGRSSLRARR